MFPKQNDESFHSREYRPTQRRNARCSDLGGCLGGEGAADMLVELNPEMDPHHQPGRPAGGEG